MGITEQHLKEIENLCKAHSVRSLHAFGSVLSDSFTGDSDIDFLVAFEDDYSAGSFAQYFDFKENLEKLFGRPVDLVCYQAIRNRIFKTEVDKTKKLLYAA